MRVTERTPEDKAREPQFDGDYYLDCQGFNTWHFIWSGRLDDPQDQ